MEKIYIGVMMAGLLVAGCAGDKGSTGPTGPQGQTGSPGPGPSVSWVSPAPGSASIALDSVVRAGFSKAMDSSTLNSSTFQVSAGGVPITGTISYNSGSQTVYFTPGLPLTAFTYCSAVLTTGVKTTDGTALPQTYTWSFTTGGSFAPSGLYVANWGGNSVLVFNSAGTANGNIFPDRNISGAATTFNHSLGLWLDKGADRLYVTSASTPSILVFNNASSATGNIAPSRSITGAATLLNRPYGLWLDALTDTLYCVNYFGNSVTIFNNISTINGNVAPSRSITGANTTFNYPSFGWLDSSSDRLYVSNSGVDSILVFNSASTIDGNITPARTITSSTTINQPWGLWLDTASNSLYVVSRSTNSILVYTNASTIDGYTVPSRMILGASTQLSDPTSIWLDSSTDRLYVANEAGNRVLVFNGASTINGNVAPSRNITGGNTGFNFSTNLWLDSD